MFPIAGQTAGPIGLKFFVDTPGWPGGDIGLKKSKKMFQNIFFSKFFFPRATNRLSSTIGGNREMYHSNTTSQVSNITRQTNFSPIS